MSALKIIQREIEKKKKKQDQGKEQAKQELNTQGKYETYFFGS